MTNGVKETKKNFVVDIDAYTNRDRYYTGDMFGQIVLIDKAKYSDLLESYNNWFDTKLDAMICSDGDITDYPGVKNYRKPQTVQ